jgi:hypothetical protein
LNAKITQSWYVFGWRKLSMKKTAIFIFLLSPFAADLWAQATYTAASCNRSDVNAVINGATHTAADGDVINIPSGSCTWTSGITVPTGIGITIQGNGAPNSTTATTGASASCSNTVITLSGATAFRMTPNYGNSTSRISCIAINYGSGANIAFSVLGHCAVSGCPNLRADNLTFTNWTAHPLAGISAGITAVGNMFGVMDHNTITGTGTAYLQLVEFSHASYMGVGSYGDNAWHLPEDYGTQKFLYIENNIFTASGSTENEGSAGSLTDEGGGRVVVRYNNFVSMDNLNFSMGWHGTESSGRPRAARAFEYYGNTWTCAGTCDQVAGARGGTGLAWGNTVNHPSGSFNYFFTLSTMRTEGSIGGWGPCDGSGSYDGNDGVSYYAGTIASGGGTTTITVSGNPGWTTNQWAPAGAPYSMHDVTRNNGMEILSNTSNTLTIMNTGGPASWLPTNGDSIQILRASYCIDQAAGRGAGILYNTTDPATPASSSSEVLSPTYLWSNTINNGNPSFGVVSPNTARLMRSRDYYTENINQAAQTTTTSPFTGTSTIGIGHGTLANRPTTCTTGVAYWATDQGNWNQSGSGGQGQLYLCTSSNTWTAYYTPYTYPHPLTTGGAPPPPSPVPGPVAPPTNLQLVSQ